MDPHTLEKIEFDKMTAILARHAGCALGKAMAARVRPTNRRPLIEQWLRQVDEMIECRLTIGLPPFGGIQDIREQIRSAVPPNSLEPSEFAVLADTFDGTHHIVQWAGKLPAHMTALHELSNRVGDFKAIAEAIRRVIDEHGEVRDDASAKLRKLRIEIGQASQNISQVVDKLLKQKNILRWLQYPNATFHEDRLVLPVAADYRGRVPGIIHRSSDSGATLFVEPAEAVELNNRIISLKADEQAEINRLLWNLTHQVHLNQQEILKTLDVLAVLDLICAKARMAREYQLNCPKVSEDRKLNLHSARHLLLVDLKRQADPIAGAHEVVPIDVRLGDDFDVLITTGPNTGGKTVALKTIALCCVMAQAGLPIPAEQGSRVPIYHDILVDIGDEQSLQQSLSTFSAHLKRLMEMLKEAGPETLLLIDELGAGTDPDEGAAIGRAILEELLRRGSSAMITTHLGVLKSLAFSEARAENSCVEFDEQTLRPTYRLRIGEPGNSHAINIAERLGLPKDVIQAARGHLTSSHQQLNRAIEGTLSSRRAAEQARAEAEQAKREAEQTKLAAEREQRALQEKHAAFDRWVQTVAQLKPGDDVFVQRFDRAGKIVRVLLHKQIAVVSVGAMEMEIPLRELGMSS